MNIGQVIKSSSLSIFIAVLWTTTVLFVVLGADFAQIVKTELSEIASIPEDIGERSEESEKDGEEKTDFNCFLTLRDWNWQTNGKFTFNRYSSLSDFRVNENLTPPPEWV